jgi:hypothetical protein
MEPAFSSTRQAATFALLLLVLLLLPALLGKTALPPREQIYSAIPWRMGAYPYLHHEIFQETGDVDIAFMGSSPMYYGIDTSYVAAALTKDLGRKATVITQAWNWAGFDPLYFIAQDLLQHRKVHTIVFLDAIPEFYQGPHEASPYWFRFGDNAEAMHRMPLQNIPQYYFAAILGAPRNLLSRIRPNLPEYLFSPDRLNLPGVDFNVESPVARLGSLSLSGGLFGKYVDYTPISHASPSDACVYASATADKFKFAKNPLDPFQLHFAKKFGALAKTYGTRLILLTFPKIDDESASFIQEREYWPEIMDTNITMVGIPPEKLFYGIAPDDIVRLFFDRSHLNRNGQEYFTKLITPSLLKIHEAQANN